MDARTVEVQEAVLDWEQCSGHCKWKGHGSFSSQPPAFAPPVALPVLSPGSEPFSLVAPVIRIIETLLGHVGGETDPRTPLAAADRSLASPRVAHPSHLLLEKASEGLVYDSHTALGKNGHSSQM